MRQLQRRRNIVDAGLRQIVDRRLAAFERKGDIVPKVVSERVDESPHAALDTGSGSGSV